MSRTLTIVILTAVSLAMTTMAAHADERTIDGLRRRGHDNGVENFLTLTTSGGYANLMNKDEIVKPMGFIGATLGVGYEMHAANGNFWLSVAGELQCMTSVLALDKSTGEQMLNNGENPEIRYGINSWKESPHYLFFSVPVLLGYVGQSFYIGAGPKLMLCAYSRSINSMNYSADGIKKTANASAILKNNPLNAAACFEIGGILTDVTNSGRGKAHYSKKVAHGRNVSLKIGFHAEYGFTNLNATTGTERLVKVSKKDKQKVSVSSLFTTDTFKERAIYPFYAGVTVTVLFGR